MSLKAYDAIEFIRGHCGSVAIEAPSDRATGAQRQRVCRRSLFKKALGFSFLSPWWASLPPGEVLVSNLMTFKEKAL